MRRYVFVLFVSALSAWWSCVVSAEISDVVLPQESGSFTAYEQRSKTPRWHITGTWQKQRDNIYTFFEQGEGLYGHYGVVRWETVGEYMIVDNSLMPFKTSRIIKDRQGVVKEALEKSYSVQSGQLQVVKRAGGTSRAYTFPVGEHFVDSRTLALALRVCVQGGCKKYIFDYLTDEPAMHRVSINRIGVETVDGVPAVKYRFLPEVGILNIVVHPFAPKTFIWFAREYPYMMLRYEGPEMGPLSAKICIERRSQ